VDNITHSLIGVALAEVAQPASASIGQRRALMVGSLVAANLPDVDLAYTWITPAPLGYLLHHRGHTHTLAGMAVLGLAMAALFGLWPATRNDHANGRARLRALIALNLVAHVAFDALNTYGVHPFYPLSVKWYYGDAVFIFEPLVWLVLAIAVVCNARRRATRWSIAALVGLLFVLVAAAGVVPAVGLAGVSLTGVLFLAALRQKTPRYRAGAALAFTVVFVAGMSVLSRTAREQARTAAMENGELEIVDIVVTPDPGMPVCWSVVVVARDPRLDELSLRRGTLSILPRYRADRCASYQLAPDTEVAIPVSGKVAWRDDFRQSLARLRALVRDDCWTRAWLQFGRAPAIEKDSILDVRFDTGIRANFTRMGLWKGRGGGCPANVTPWAIPRADVLGTIP
jgi:inner membrane protein